jgi:hypothetical protein
MLEEYHKVGIAFALDAEAVVIGFETFQVGLFQQRFEMTVKAQFGGDIEIESF